jgi:hypothetical protein
MHPLSGWTKHLRKCQELLGFPNQFFLIARNYGWQRLRQGCFLAHPRYSALAWKTQTAIKQLTSTL